MLNSLVTIPIILFIYVPPFLWFCASVSQSILLNNNSIFTFKYVVCISSLEYIGPFFQITKTTINRYKNHIIMTSSNGNIFRVTVRGIHARTQYYHLATNVLTQPYYCTTSLTVTIHVLNLSQLKLLCYILNQMNMVDDGKLYIKKYIDGSPHSIATIDYKPKRTGCIMELQKPHTD